MKLLRLVLTFVAGASLGMVLHARLFPEKSNAPGADEARPPAPASLFRGVPYVDYELVPSSILGLLGVMKDSEDNVLNADIIRTLALNPEEVQAVRKHLRKLAENWAYAVNVRSMGDSQWQLSYPATAAKAQLMEEARWAEQLLGYERAYLFMVLMEQDFSILFLRDDVSTEKKTDSEWSLIAGQRGFSFDLRQLQPHSPMIRLQLKCSAR